MSERWLAGVRLTDAPERTPLAEIWIHSAEYPRVIYDGPMAGADRYLHENELESIVRETVLDLEQKVAVLEQERREAEVRASFCRSVARSGETWTQEAEDGAVRICRRNLAHDRLRALLKPEGEE